MRVRLLVGSALGLFLAGCSPSVTRTLRMERATAELLGDRARVVSGGARPSVHAKGYVARAPHASLVPTVGRERGGLAFVLRY